MIVCGSDCLTCVMLSDVVMEEPSQCHIIVREKHNRSAMYIVVLHCISDKRQMENAVGLWCPLLFWNASLEKMLVQ